MLKERYEHILLFDFETTGLSHVNDRIIEIGAILLQRQEPSKQYKIVKELSVLIKQDRPLPDKIVEITNITDDMLKEKGILEEEAFHLLNDMVKDNCLMVAYNIQFDYGFLTSMYRRMLNNPHYEIKHDLLDVMAIYKDRHPFPHKLDNAVKHYHIEIANTHRALDDIKATFLVLVEMIKERDSMDKYINVIGFNPKYGVSGLKASHVTYVPQYGNRLELERR
ncbi:MAG: 3'-5' exonuclease [Paracholeplasma sp.]|nr:3'-5' exonuclease [Paracholeplasma sp.]MDY3196006.1 3'-5' exonuclease [Paracholeplasma sp.]